jgi:hypothetical protein
MGWWEPHWQHTAVLNLALLTRPPNSTRMYYYYQVSGCGLSSTIGSFRAPNIGHQHTLTAVLTADMGATTPDRISQRECRAMPPPSPATYRCGGR